ncbi:MAG: RNA 2',3'-cyclic phosphodiesterase [archaeon]
MNKRISAKRFDKTLKKVFFAINLPEKTRKKIFETYCKKFPQGVNAVKEQNIHITLLFLGYFPEEKINELKEKINEIKQEKFHAVISGINSFNSRVLFLEIKEGEKEISALHEKICTKLEITDNRFNSHITIARNKKMNSMQFRELAEKLKKIHFEEKIEAKEFDLMESVLLPEGPDYKKNFSFSLND